MFNLFEKAESEEVEKSVEEPNDLDVVFDKLYEDSTAACDRKNTLLMRVAKDSVGHMFVVELIPLLTHIQPFAKVNISALFKDFESDLKKNQFGLIVVKCLKGAM